MQRYENFSTFANQKSSKGVKSHQNAQFAMKNVVTLHRQKDPETIKQFINHLNN